jgi:outer membrane protein assembly factor BamB
MYIDIYSFLTISSLIMARADRMNIQKTDIHSLQNRGGEFVNRSSTTLFSLCVLTGLMLAVLPSAHAVDGWLSWRGPNQDGTSSETHLPTTWEPDGENHLWTYTLRGSGTPVIAGDRVFVFGYAGSGPDLQEFLVCLDAKTGEEIWKEGFNDYLSDNVYDRYSIGSPVVDGDTGNVYLQTTPGEFLCYTRDGKLLWSHSMMEDFGRLTFPNGRTGAPVIDENLVIVRGITSNWGADGPARDRFYAFDKVSGELVWTSTPGVAPQDSSFSTPVFGWENGKRVFYCGTGCGNVVCVNVKTGEPIWRYPMSHGGVNSSVLQYDDQIIAIHGKENIDSSEAGRMVSIQTGLEPKPGEAGPVVLTAEQERWRAELVMFTSSPVLVGDLVYQMVYTGELKCIDANTGAVLWDLKLANDQLHASPLYADGKLYVPMRDGHFYIIKADRSGGEILDTVQLEGNGLGSPSIYNGRIFVHTTEKLYCFGNEKPGKPTVKKTAEVKAGPATQLQIVPSEIVLHPGQEQDFSVYALDALGNRVEKVDAVSWERYVPSSARVKATMDADFNADGVLVAAKDASMSAGAFRATTPDGLSGVIRGRILPALPFNDDFETYPVETPHATEANVKFGFPPLPWIGARFKWEVRERDGSQVLAKTLDRVLFQRAITFIGDSNLSNYTISADVMTDGNRRMMSNVGVINQRYVVALIGNWQQLEVSSNHSRVKVGVPFEVKPNTWYRITSRVDVAADGSGVVRAKAWARGEAEPESWTIEVPHKQAHRHGSPGIWGFSPQSRFHVYVDNIHVAPNE